jgi:RNA polymerase sigma-70 factor (ECF subfamily)
VAAVDVALVLRARRGDRDAFALLYETLARPVARFVGGIVRDHAARDDAVAETFLQAWRDLPRLRDAERFEAWLFRIAHRRALSEVTRRRAASLSQLADAERPDPPDTDRWRSPTTRFELVSDARVVRDAIARLPDDQREAIVLRYLRGLSYDEVSRALGRSNAAARQLCQRALRRLRNALGEFD